MIPVIWSKSFPVKIISGIIKKGYYPSPYKTKYMVRYKSFSLPPLLPPHNIFYTIAYTYFLIKEIIHLSAGDN